MLLDRNKYTESGYIGEELIGNTQDELLQRCMAMQQSIKDKDFSYDDALKAYSVNDSDYKAFVARSANLNIFISYMGNNDKINNQFYFEVFEQMLLHLYPKPSAKVNKIVKELEQMSHNDAQ